MQMFKVLRALFLAVMIIVVQIAQVWAALPTEQYEYNNAGDNSVTQVYGANIAAQTFTPGTVATGNVSHTVSAIRLLVYRVGTPGTVTVAILETAAGDPTGAAKATGTLAASSTSTNSSGVWYEVTLTTPFSIAAGTTYALVVSAQYGDSTNYLGWRYDSSGSLNNGNRLESANTGVSWTSYSATDYMFEIWGESLLSVIRGEVYSGYLEDDDLLFVFDFTNAYVPYYPNGDAAKFFNIQLTSVGGSTVLAQSNQRAWGNEPGSIYLSASQAASITVGTALRLYLSGSVTPYPATHYTLLAEDWRGTDLRNLDAWVITTAKNMQDYYNLDDLVTFVRGKGTVLTEKGGVKFDTGIPYLSAIRPDLFQVVNNEPEAPSTTHTNAWTALTWEDMVGSGVAVTLNMIGTWAGTDGRTVGALGLFLAFLTLAVLLIPKGQAETTAAMGIGFPLIIVGAYLRFFDIQLVAVLLSVFAFLFVWSFWWTRT